MVTRCAEAANQGGMELRKNRSSRGELWVMPYSFVYASTKAYSSSRDNGEMRKPARGGGSGGGLRIQSI
ncbi:hypothetical protein GCM10010106_50940 [Thermopolyspora flexuosa]|nr:hypothetical protein GCM10010106_50940 [Thermopolyspora flexuosa]